MSTPGRAREPAQGRAQQRQAAGQAAQWTGALGGAVFSRAGRSYSRGSEASSAVGSTTSACVPPVMLALQLDADAMAACQLGDHVEADAGALDQFLDTDLGGLCEQGVEPAVLLLAPCRGPRSSISISRPAATACARTTTFVALR